MCGIAGFISSTPSHDADAMRAMGHRMASALAHRGPDDDGLWCDPTAGVVLAHRRLSILDLSPAGHQPMASACGRYVVAFNGEIYNHAELRRELEGAAAAGLVWRGHSDTEVLLAAIVRWGLDAALVKSRGMFAIALWDAVERRLHLARDRMGEKPLYYGRFGQTWLFGSELKALMAHETWRGRIDRAGLAEFLRHAYVPATCSIFEGVNKVPAGARVTLAADSAAAAPTACWRLRDAVRAGEDSRRTSAVDALGATAATDELERLLLAAVGEQSLADVPVGAFLSGGIDSSTVVALMQAGRATPVKTFTIGYADAQYDESVDARHIARHLGTDHVELRVTAADAMAVVPRLPAMYDEPFADSSQIPTALVAALARRDVVVALSGDGGDELFGGYNRHVWLDRLWRRLRHVPGPLRRGAAHALLSRPPAQWDALFTVIARIGGGRRVPRMPGEKLHKLAGMLAAAGPGAAYRRLVSQWPDPALLVPGFAPTETADAAEIVPGMPGLGLVEAMLLCDAETYLPDDILVKVDRAAMAVSLETRVPLLDPRIVEFAWRLPLSLKHREGSSKWLLRQVLYRHVPRDLVERPKMGFGVPVGDWLRGPLRDWAEALLDLRRLREEGHLDPRPIHAAWQAHLAGSRNLQHQLWPVLMFQAWRAHWQI